VAEDPFVREISMTENDDDEFDSKPGTRFKPGRAPKKNKWEVAASLRADESAEAERFGSAVRVTNAERAWLVRHLSPFQHSKLIDDVAFRVKAGKEATVYACSGHPSSEEYESVPGGPRAARRVRTHHAGTRMASHQGHRAEVSCRFGGDANLVAHA
jgi:hypothetical protein